jgi:ABC-type polysaccharide/polyol phosphate transport system ATPase subunit
VSATLTTRSASSAKGAAAVSASGLSKSFRLPLLRYSTLKERVLHPLKFSAVNVLRALQDVSFEVSAGEFFGIVGRNGSGKSTLLKCLAGIYSIDSGTVRVSGRISPFIELGVGFNLELTARDNAIINSIMVGLSRREARRRFDEIIAFAELEDFLDMKLKNYSSGMLVRLAFATAVMVDADVLLIDEVLAVGDVGFQKKCFDSFERLRREGCTVLFVTHDMSAVRQVCDRAMLLEGGRVAKLGDTDVVTAAYNEVNFARLDATALEGAERSPTEGAVILDAWFEDESGTRIVACSAGQPVVACMRATFGEPLTNPCFQLVLRNELQHPVVAVGSDPRFSDSGSYRAGETVVIRARFENWLASGRYGLTAVVARDAPDAGVLDHRPNVAALVVHAPQPSGALMELPYELDITRE